MSDDREDAMVERAAARAEEKAARRRWLTIAELVAIAGVIIAALSLWMSWSDRRADEAERTTEQRQAAHAGELVTLKATPRHDGDTLALSDPAHDIQSIDISFPRALDLPSKTAVLDPTIEAAWFADKLLKLTDNGPDAQDGRLPVMIASEYWDGDQHRRSTAIYDVVWHTEGRFLRGRTLRLRGIVLRTRSAGAQALDRIWAQEKPAGR